MTTPAPAPEPLLPELPQPAYPAIESFIEQATADDVAALFAQIKQGLQELKGPRAVHGKKVEGALARAEELLLHLLKIREQLGSGEKR